MFSFEDGEPGFHCIQQSPAVPQLLSCVLVLPCPLKCAGNWGPKLTYIPTPKMYERRTTSPLFANSVEPLWHQDIKCLQWKTIEVMSKSNTVLMCSHSSLQLDGWSWEVRHSLGSGTVKCGLQHPLYCWPLCSHFLPHTFMCMISVLAAFECKDR